MDAFPPQGFFQVSLPVDGQQPAECTVSGGHPPSHYLASLANKPASLRILITDLSTTSVLDHLYHVGQLIVICPNGYIDCVRPGQSLLRHKKPGPGWWLYGQKFMEMSAQFIEQIPINGRYAVARGPLETAWKRRLQRPPERMKLQRLEWTLERIERMRACVFGDDYPWPKNSDPSSDGSQFANGALSGIPAVSPARQETGTPPEEASTIARAFPLRMAASQEKQAAVFGGDPSCAERLRSSDVPHREDDTLSGITAVSASRLEVVCPPEEASTIAPALPLPVVAGQEIQADVIGGDHPCAETEPPSHASCSGQGALNGITAASLSETEAGRPQVDAESVPAISPRRLRKAVSEHDLRRKRQGSLLTKLYRSFEEWRHPTAVEII